jgi:hypothetical protein
MPARPSHSADDDVPRPGDHARRILETSPFPILLVSLVGVVLLTALAPSLVVGDTWLGLMAGREIAEHGLPSVDEITILGAGRTWTDQQWLAHLLFYAVHGLAGIRGIVLVGVALVLVALSLAFATARTSGATSRSTFLIGALAVLAGPWGWTLRAQVTALPLFAGLLWVLVDAGRRGVRRRTLVALPLLVLWANLHGSVVLGAMLTVALAVVELAARRARGEAASIALVLVVTAPLCVFASPYGWKLAAYYDRMLVDAPFAEILREWQWSRPSGTTALLWILAAVTVLLLALTRCRRRLVPFELVALGITLAGAIQAVRGVIWFALAAAAILPAALDGLIARPDIVAPRLNRMLAVASIVAALIAFVVAAGRSSSWYERRWPEAQVEAVRAATRDPATRLLPTDHTADWLLWRIPDLRGRVAYDARYELLDDAAIDAIARFGRREGAWTRLSDPYRVVIVDEPAHLAALTAEPGARVVQRSGATAVIVRR